MKYLALIIASSFVGNMALASAKDYHDPEFKLLIQGLPTVVLPNPPEELIFYLDESGLNYVRHDSIDFDGKKIKRKTIVPKDCIETYVEVLKELGRVVRLINDS